ncbi:hypothetical protein CAL26_21135 [Bordetella genomosp. 9]|uniref:GNAT family N-acetyltransferase n=1 Tax=Bordetella genomosp. 9 TaxID=1416803 RepID=A0A261R548_9BORD|nr:hypothetical protein CAL26_21135 [Bordetella genomosp. 9]
MKCEDWAASDRAAVLRAFKRHYDDSLYAGHPYAKLVDFDYGWQTINNGDVAAALTHGYLVVYDITPTWYCPHNLFIEQMVLRVEDRPGFLRRVIAAMEDEARRWGCAGIATGDAMGIAMSAAYRRAGYSPVVSQFYKELPNG